MNNKKDKQTRLITINNLCSCFSVAIEKHYNMPDHEELLALIKKLAEECGEYLKV